MPKILFIALRSGTRARILSGSRNLIGAMGLSLSLILLPGFLSRLHAQMGSDSIRKEQFFKVLRSGDTAELEKLLADGADANASCEGYSALMTASLAGSIEQMDILIRHGAIVNYVNEDSLTALWMAITDPAKTLFLLDHGANPQLPSKKGYTVLVKLATFPGSSKIMQLLIDRGADPRKSAPDNYLLYNAAAACDTANLGICIRSGLRVNDSVYNGDYPIFSALNYRWFPSLKMLVENGANVNARQPDDTTPLMYAAVNNDEESFYYLLDHGADATAVDKKGYTALMYLELKETDDPAMTQALIAHGVPVNAKAKDGTDALSLAQEKGNSQSVQIIKKYIR